MFTWVKGSNKVLRPREASPPVAQLEECQHTDTQRVNVDAAPVWSPSPNGAQLCSTFDLPFPSCCLEEPQAPIVTVEFRHGGTDAKVSFACAGRLEK